MLLLRAAIVLTFLVLLPTLRVIRVLSSQQPTPAEAALLESIGKYDDDCCCQSGQKDPPEAESAAITIDDVKKTLRDDDKPNEKEGEGSSLLFLAPEPGEDEVKTLFGHIRRRMSLID